MAIKVSGTTVVDDSRGLTNIATVDATTAAAISAAGVGGGGEHDFVASGAISNGDVVAVNADGTVSIIQEYNFSLTEEANAATGETGSYVGLTTDNNGTVFLGYTDSTTNAVYGMAGTVSGSTITWGTPISLGIANPSYTAVVYDPDQDVFIVVANSSAVPKAVACSVTGTTITAGSPLTVSGIGQNVYSALAYSPSDNKTVWVTTDWNDNKKLHITHLTATGTSLSAASFFEITTLNTENFSVTCDNSGNIFVVYKDNTTPNYGRIDHLTVNGSSFTKSAATTIFRSGHAAEPFASYDILEDKILIAWRDLTDYRGYSIAASWDGSSFSFGSIYEFDNSINVSPLQLIYSQEKKAHLLVYYGARDATVLKLDGDTITEPVSDITLTANTNDTLLNAKTFTYDNSLDKFIGAASDYTPQTQYYIIINYDFDNNVTDYIGIAAENIADTATGAVTIDGGVASVPLDNYDLANASYTTSSPSLQSVASSPRGLAFKADGTKMYVSSIDNFAVYQYSLSTAWDASTASYDSVSFSVLSETAYPMEIFFKPDGTEMYIASLFPSSVFQYTLSTAWNISSASFTGSVSAAVTMDAILKSDGTKMFTLSGSTITSYTLSTAWDITSASSDALTLSVSSQDGDPRALFVTPDGLKLFVVGSSTDTVYRYSLPSSWNLSGASYDSVSFSVAAQDTIPFGLEFKTDGKIMYILGATGTVVDQYSTGTFGGFTINTPYFVADDGSFTTTNNGRKIGKAISATEIIVDSALTGDETNEYLGSLV